MNAGGASGAPARRRYSGSGTPALHPASPNRPSHGQNDLLLDVHRADEQIAILRPRERATHGLELAGRNLDALGGNANPRELVSENGRNLARRAPAQQGWHLLHDHMVERHDAPRGARQRAELLVVAVARLSQQQQPPRRGNASRRLAQRSQAVGIVRVVDEHGQSAKVIHVQPTRIVVRRRAKFPSVSRMLSTGTPATAASSDAPSTFSIL